MTPPTHLPADALPDLLAPGVPVLSPSQPDFPLVCVTVGDLDGYGREVWVVSPRRPKAQPLALDAAKMLLDLREPLGRAQLCRVLARGLKHERCRGSGVVAAPDGDALDCSCDDGYTRKPAPAWHLLPESEGGHLPDALASHGPALLVAHALDVAGGGVGVLGVLGAWEAGHRAWRGLHVRVRDNLAVSQVGERGWRLCYLPGFRDGFGPSGPEAGPEGQRLADAAALAHGFALLNPDGLVLPTWGRP